MTCDVLRPLHLEIVLAELEAISVSLSQCDTPLPKGWVVNLLFQFQNMSNTMLMELYISLFDLWWGTSSDKLCELISSTTYILFNWTYAVYE